MNINCCQSASPLLVRRVLYSKANAKSGLEEKGFGRECQVHVLSQSFLVRTVSQFETKEVKFYLLSNWRLARKLSGYFSLQTQVLHIFLFFYYIYLLMNEFPA